MKKSDLSHSEKKKKTAGMGKWKVKGTNVEWDFQVEVGGGINEAGKG